ncbi:MAG TPA: hypothetical protein VGP94_12160 [Tepidisphaeraceae bacterium]|jgi:hypothetical protein|nr:hypothetical protein [Tepidisphaeraceae bacterium]
MNDSAEQPQPPLLHYADLPIGIGIIVEPLPDGIRITRPASHGAAAAMLILTILFSPLLVLVIIFSGDLEALRLPIRAIRRAFRPMTIEVTATSLSLLNAEIDGRPQDITHPRHDVYDVRYVSHSNNVAIRVHGQELIELCPFKDPRMQQWLADTLVQALRLK